MSFFTKITAKRVMTCVWTLSLGLALIFYSSSVCSEKCEFDWQCSGSKECCTTLGICMTIGGRCVVSCKKDSDCPDGKHCYVDLGICTDPPITLPDLNIQTIPDLEPITVGPEWDDSCAVNSDCEGDAVCEVGNCVTIVVDTEQSSSDSSMSNLAIWLIVAAAFLKIVFWLCYINRRRERLRQRLLMTTIIPPPTGEATTTHTSHDETQPGSAYDIIVIEVEQVSPSAPPDAPPPYSALEFERQGNDKDGQGHVKMQSESAVPNSAAWVVFGAEDVSTKEHPPPSYVEEP